MESKENRWFLLGIVLTIGLTCGLAYAFSVFIQPLEKEFGWDRRQISMAFTLYFVIGTVGTTFCGDLIAKFGIKITAMIGGTLAALGLFMASYTNSLWMLYVSYGALTGVGLGLVTITPMSVLMPWFPDKKGLISGLTTMALAFGTFFLGAKLAGSFVVSYGWSATFKILAAILFIVVLGGAQFFKVPPAGYRPPNWTPPAGQQIGQWGFTRGEMMKTKACWLICLWIVCVQTCGMMIISQLVSLVTDRGISLENALLCLSVFAITNGLGRLFFALLCDKVGRVPSMTLDSVFMGLGMLGLIYLKGLGLSGVMLSLVCIAMAYGGVFSQFPLLASNFFGPKHFPKNFGFYFIPGGLISSFLGPYVATTAQVKTGSYDPALFVAVGLCVMATIVALTLKAPQRLPEATPGPAPAEG